MNDEIIDLAITMAKVAGDVSPDVLRKLARVAWDHGARPATSEPTDEQALELGSELLTTAHSKQDRLYVGREAWIRGARPRGF